MVVRYYAYGNVGRDKSPFHLSTRIDLDALRGLRDAIPDEKAAVFLNEINEGDDNNEYAAIKQVFPHWRIYGRNTREPILLSPDNPPARSKVLWVPNTAVAKWSPQRSITLVHLEDEPETLMTCHPAAGANGQGERPKIVRPHLQTSWDNLIARRDTVKYNLYRRGRNVTEMSDLNAYAYAWSQIHANSHEKTVWRAGTDWGIVQPAKGFDQRFFEGVTVDFDIDSHNGHVMHGHYNER